MCAGKRYAGLAKSEPGVSQVCAQLGLDQEVEPQAHPVMFVRARIVLRHHVVCWHAALLQPHPFQKTVSACLPVGTQAGFAQAATTRRVKGSCVIPCLGVHPHLLHAFPRKAEAGSLLCAWAFVGAAFP